MTEPTPYGTSAAPVCPRHPDRESYVRCQRCDRPTCGECQRPAAVGIQCVDCVREQARTVRQPRTTFGGRVATGRPVVTLTLIVVNVVAYLLQRLNPEVTSALAFVPLVAAEQPWRFLTSAFLHSPFFLLHIAFNMYALWLLGPYLEHVLGRLRFAVLYLLAAVGGSVGYLLLTNPLTAPGAVGASGAVFGLFGAIMVVNRRLGRRMGQIGVIIAINAVLPFLFPVIAWQAHLGGLVTGAAIAAVLAYAPRGRRAAVQTVGVAAVVVALLVLTLLQLA